MLAITDNIKTAFLYTAPLISCLRNDTHFCDNMYRHVQATYAKINTHQLGQRRERSRFLRSCAIRLSREEIALKVSKPPIFSCFSDLGCSLRGIVPCVAHFYVQHNMVPPGWWTLMTAVLLRLVQQHKSATQRMLLVAL